MAELAARSCATVRTQACIGPIAVRQRGKGAVRTLAELRDTPNSASNLPRRELRSFAISLSVNAGTKAREGGGSFVTSVPGTIDTFYADVVQHIKPWTPRPVEVPTTNPGPEPRTPAPWMTAEAGQTLGCPWS